MAHRRNPSASFRTPSAPSPSESGRRQFLERGLVGAVASLAVARMIVSGDDPGMLRLTSSAGPLFWNLAIMIVAAWGGIHRAVYGRRTADRIEPIWLIPFGIALWTLAASYGADRYSRPGRFIAGEWVALGCLLWMVRRFFTDSRNSGGLVNVLIASIAASTGLCVYQSLESTLGLPRTRIELFPASGPLVGDPEFYPEVAAAPFNPSTPYGPFGRPEPMLILLAIGLVLSLMHARSAGSQPLRRAVLGLLPVVFGAMLIHTAIRCDWGAIAGGWSRGLRWVIDYPLFGVGPGNQSRVMEGSTTPIPFWLNLAMASGIAVPIALGVVFFRMLKGPAGSTPAAPATATDTADTADTERKTRWEFHSAGIAGLGLGFLWTINAVPVETGRGEVVVAAGAAVIRACVWFAVFAILEMKPLNGPRLTRFAGLAVAVWLVSGLLFEGAGNPAVLVPAAVLGVVYLHGRLGAIGTAGTVPARRPINIAWIIAPAPAFVVLLFTYLAWAVIPGWSTADTVREARFASRIYPEKHHAVAAARSGGPRAQAQTEAKNFLMAMIVNPLRDAVERDPDNAPLRLELSRWTRPAWQQFVYIEPKSAITLARIALQTADIAVRQDPRNPAGNYVVYEALLLFLSASQTLAQERLESLNRRIEYIAERSPREEVALRYRAVMLLMVLGDSSELQREFLKLWERAADPQGTHGTLTDEERTELLTRGRSTFKNPSAELTKILGPKKE